MEGSAPNCSVRPSLGTIAPVVNVMVCVCACIVAWISSLYLTEGVPVYAIDDAYIHLAHARNLAETGIWGIRPDEYAFCSSSPIWSCLLALLFKVFGYHECVPGIVVGLSCIGIVVVLTAIFMRAQFRAGVVVALTALILLSIPISTAAILGMEHAAHVALSLLFVAMWLKDERSMLKWSVIAALATGIRYESLFIIAPIFVLELVAGRVRQAFAVFLGASLPVVAYGAYAIMHGGYFLPNSLVVKAVLPSQQNFVDRVIDVVVGVGVSNTLVHFLAVALLIASICPEVPLRKRKLSIALAVATFGHLVFAKTGWQYNVNRYEMYLLACGLVAVFFSGYAILKYDKSAPSGCAHWRRMIVFSVLLVCALSSVVAGITNAIAALEAPRATFEVPMTAARVFSTLQEDARGAIYLNDLGLIAARTRVPVIDVCGLGEQDTFELRVKGLRNDRELAVVLKKRKARYAAVFDCFLWTKGTLVNEFGLKPAVKLIAPSRDVWVGAPLGLYAFSSEDEIRLARHVANLPFQLPKNVSVEIRPDLVNRLRQEGE